MFDLYKEDPVRKIGCGKMAQIHATNTRMSGSQSHAPNCRSTGDTKPLVMSPASAGLVQFASSSGFKLLAAI